MYGQLGYIQGYGGVDIQSWHQVTLPYISPYFHSLESVLAEVLLEQNNRSNTSEPSPLSVTRPFTIRCLPFTSILLNGFLHFVSFLCYLFISY